jgi:predicted DNA-binding transcriptional regulator AlpA
MRKARAGGGGASSVEQRIPSRETQLRQQVVHALLGGGPAAGPKPEFSGAIEPPLRATEVCALFGFSLATLRRRMAEGEFPEPAFGRGGIRRRILLWRVSDLRAYIENGTIQPQKGRKASKSARR